jgi:hypothetical protein
MTSACRCFWNSGAKLVQKKEPHKKEVHIGTHSYT